MLRIFITCVILFCVCAQPAVADENAALNNEPSRLQFALDPFADSIGHSIKLGNAKAKIFEQFGRPIRQEVSTAKERTSDIILTYYFLQYEGLDFGLVEREDGRTFITGIVITGNAYELKYRVQIGSTRTKIVSLFRPDDFRASRNPMLVYTHLLEDRYAREDPAKNANWQGPVIGISFDFDSEDRVTRIAVGNIRL